MHSDFELVRPMYKNSSTFMEAFLLQLFFLITFFLYSFLPFYLFY